ncbi:MAG: hypothetical protein QM730_14535 [Anaerolineales bacterium]
MSKTTKWIIGIVAALIVLQFAMPFVWQLISPATGAYGYGMPMMRGGYGSPMMGGYGHMGFGLFGGLFMWLLPLGLLVLIALGIVYLWKKINEKPVDHPTEQ